MSPEAVSYLDHLTVLASVCSGVLTFVAGVLLVARTGR